LTRIYKALQGVRGEKPVDIQKLEKILVRFSNLISEQRWIKELDINPLIASSEQLLALDARVLLFGPDVNEEELPHLAIRPYPTQYISQWTMKDGTKITIRPIRAEDEPFIVDFHETLSDRSVYMRYLHPMLLSDRAAHERLSRICHVDYDREITLIADREDAKAGELRILGALRMTKLHGTNSARFSLLISDQFHGMGVGSALMKRLIPVAREENLECLEAIMTKDNEGMKYLCERHGFNFTDTEDGMLKAELYL
jgi:acetyltransferase